MIFKNKILSVVVGLVIVAVIVPAGAMAASLTQAQISAIVSLLQVFGADSTTVANVQVALNGGTPVVPPTVWCHTFNSNLGVGNKTCAGDRDIETASLEVALVKEGLLVQHQGDCVYFDEKMASAVVRFQTKYGILQTGYVGPITRAKLNALYGCRTNQNITINSVSGPTSLNIGQTGTWIINTNASVTAKVKYLIEWGGEGQDGISGPYIATSNNISISHSYSRAWTYTLIVRVWDENNCSPIFNVPTQIVQDSQKCVVSKQITVVVNSGTVQCNYDSDCPGVCPSCTAGATCGACVSYKCVNNRCVPNTTPSITVTSPNGGERLVRGQIYNITWNPQNISQVFDIAMQSTDSNGNSENYEILMSSSFARANPTHVGNAVIRDLGSTTTSYAWTIPIDMKFGAYNKLIVIGTPVGCESGGCGGPVLDWSDNYFTITQ